MSNTARAFFLVWLLTFTGCLPFGGPGYTHAASAKGCDFKLDCDIGQTCFNHQCQKRCTNDYDCGYGNQCYKPPYDFDGICVVPTNAYGGREHTSPRTDSFGPGTSSGCSFKADCPIGFQCEKSRGALYGACLKRGY